MPISVASVFEVQLKRYYDFSWMSTQKICRKVVILPWFLLKPHYDCSVNRYYSKLHTSVLKLQFQLETKRITHKKRYFSNPPNIYWYTHELQVWNLTLTVPRFFFHNSFRGVFIWWNLFAKSDSNWSTEAGTARSSVYICRRYRRLVNERVHQTENTHGSILQ